MAAPGARGRTLREANGTYTGKAPACIVDLKAAVRYLRHNDKVMPGDAERIISNGTSAGGALSALLGATGNSADYAPYLKAIGAAEARDDIYATSAYCPITNLDHADAAYEWLFGGLNTYHGWGGKGALTADQAKVSGELKALFPAYLNGLGLRGPDGTALTLDASGTGSFRDYVKSFVVASAEQALQHGADLAGLTWVTVKDGTVTDIDFDGYVAYATRMKTPPAFDALDLSLSRDRSLWHGGRQQPALHPVRQGPQRRSLPGGQDGCEDDEPDGLHRRRGGHDGPALAHSPRRDGPRHLPRHPRDPSDEAAQQRL